MRNIRIQSFACAATLSIWSALWSAEDAPPFKQAIDPIQFSFPADHASHAGYQTEWWYVTGNVNDEKGREFGYQFTIFRRALSSKSAQERGRTSAWAADDFYLLHLAISDVEGKQHVDHEALERGVLGVAGATEISTVLKERPPYDRITPEITTREAVGSEPIRVWTSETSFVRQPNGWQLKANSSRVGMDLKLEEYADRPGKHMLHGKDGEKGLSRKGPKPGQASYYYSVPRLSTTGSLTLDGKQFKITSGVSWMDHEFGSNQLSTDQAGWEWFAVQLDSGVEIMLYVLRNKDGSIEPSSSGSWSDSVGCCHYFKVTDAMLKSGGEWKSPHSGATYPLEWDLHLPLNIVLKIKPVFADQEFHSAQGAKMNYYEGAIHVEGTQDGKPVKGRGYLEITGKNLGGRM